MADQSSNTPRGLFLVDISKFALSNSELTSLEQDINRVVLEALKKKADVTKFKIDRPGPPMGFWIREG